MGLEDPRDPRELPELPQEPPEDRDPDADERDYWERADNLYEQQRDRELEED